MKLLFLILAHNQPAQASMLADTLTKAGRDATAMIHFDAGGSSGDFEKLDTLVAGKPRIILTADRVRCRWGDYSLVQAVVTTLKQAMQSGAEFDYVVLLSGACLPSRPIRQLERYLEQSNGREFIEVSDPSWMVEGLRSERYELYFPVSPAIGYNIFEDGMIKLQRALGVKRKVPDSLRVKFGSQWWTLSWSICKRIVEYLDGKPEVPRFFQHTYIPDEMVFPTLVNRLADSSAVAGFGLTSFQFTDKGKPIVFYDDHADIVDRLNKFFFRKVSPEASALRAKYLEVAGAADDGGRLDNIGQPNPEYAMRMAAQTSFPRPGQIYHRLYYTDVPAGILKAVRQPYVVVFGERRRVADILSRLDHPGITNLGNLFSTSSAGFGELGEGLGGLKSSDVAIRDAYPAQYLARVRSRIDTVAAIGWSPGDNPAICGVIARDPSALCILSLHNDASLFGQGEFLADEAIGVPVSLTARALRAFQIVGITDEEILPDNLIVDDAAGAGGQPIPLPDKFGGHDWSETVAAALSSRPTAARALRSATAVP